MTEFCRNLQVKPVVILIVSKLDIGRRQINWLALSTAAVEDWYETVTKLIGG